MSTAGCHGRRQCLDETHHAVESLRLSMGTPLTSLDASALAELEHLVAFRNAMARWADDVHQQLPSASPAARHWALKPTAGLRPASTLVVSALFLESDHDDPELLDESMSPPSRPAHNRDWYLRQACLLLAHAKVNLLLFVSPHAWSLLAPRLRGRAMPTAFGRAILVCHLHDVPILKLRARVCGERWLDEQLLHADNGGVKSHPPNSIATWAAKINLASLGRRCATWNAGIPAYAAFVDVGIADDDDDDVSTLLAEVDRIVVKAASHRRLVTASAFCHPALGAWPSAAFIGGRVAELERLDEHLAAVLIRVGTQARTKCVE